MANDRPHLKQRLVLCLDGTWNAQDSGTNIYHLSNLIAEGKVHQGEEVWRQRVYYQEGVGTGVLDSFTGGAFGLGLSENVRGAYDWLVEKYCDGDEIYVFGFSRGAFTARSLVGLIAKCGLLHRGAPIPPSELWDGYRILGRHRHPKSGMEPSANWWERIFGKRKPPFKLREEILEPANRAEALLLAWSRRVPIKCVGVFDTVGALGLNALALPWIRDVTVQFHDARLTSLVENGFQALAIDEHRGNFAHIPWFRRTDSQMAADRTELNGHLEQRWFTGAHSNIGGGYEDDVLAQRALTWMIQKTQALGLVFRDDGKSVPNPRAPEPEDRCLPLLSEVIGVQDLADQAPALRDSFSEFAGGIWKHVIRAKRHYRRLAPVPELQDGQPVQSVNETLDPSVSVFARKDSKYAPPNLWRYRREHEPGFNEPEPPHRYSETNGSWWVALALWLAFIGYCGCKLGGVLDRNGIWVGKGFSWRWLALAAPALALLVDWRSSALNHKIALDPDGMAAERRQSWLNAYLFLRLGAVLAAATGAIFLVVYKIGWVWVLKEWPPAHSVALAWLLALDGLWMLFVGTMSWNGGPMTDAGLSSIYYLQIKDTPEGVQKRLADWAGSDDQRLLMPVVRALWRDMLAFIPVYSAVLFFGSWLALSIAWLHTPLVEHWKTDQGVVLGLLSCDRRLWLSVLVAAILCAMADYFEDWSELRFIRVFPAQPPKAAVRWARAATWFKFLAFSVGLALTAAATLALAVNQVVKTCLSEGGTLSVIAALGALAALFAVVQSFRPKPDESETHATA